MFFTLQIYEKTILGCNKVDYIFKCQFPRHIVVFIKKQNKALPIGEHVNQLIILRYNHAL